VGAIYCSNERFVNLFPPSVASLVSQSLQTYLQVQRDTHYLNLSNKLDRFWALTGSGATGRVRELEALLQRGSGSGDVDRPAKLRVVLDLFANINSSHWATAFGLYDWRFDALYNFPGEQMNRKIAHALGYVGDLSNSAEVCNLVEQKRNQNVNDFLLALEPADENFTVFSACTGCHMVPTSQIQTAYIPFDKSNNLARFFRANPGIMEDILHRIDAPLEDQPFHMPPSRVLSQEERAAIIEYFE